MAQIRNTVLGAFLVLACATAALPAQVPGDEVPTFTGADVPQAYRDLGNYLARDGGRWRAPNPNHDPENPRSASHFGLWFEWAVGEHMLELQIVAYVGDEVRSSSRSFWAWHAIDERLTYTAVDPGGGLALGDTTFPAAHVFRTETVRVGPDGSRMPHRDDNTLVSADVHTNISYSRSDTGEWTPQSEWRWERQRQ